MRVPFLIPRGQRSAIVVAVALLAFASSASAQVPKKRNPGLTWTPPNTDSKIADLSDTPPCSLHDVMKQASERATEFVDDLQKFDAIEHSQSAESNPDAQTFSSEDARFDFMVEFSTVNGNLSLKESRQELDHNDANAANLEDTGVPALVLVFHPDYSDDFTYQCLGAAAWEGQPAWVVAFHQMKGKRSRLMAFRTPTGNFGAKLKGRAWIAQDSGQVIHLETNLIEPIGLIGLMSNAVSIDYAPVQFHSANVKLWLPIMAIAYSQYDKYTIVKKHTYSDFKLFSVGTQSVIENPKIPAAAQDAPAAAAPEGKPTEPPSPKQ
jgi:hypothetical protein